MAHRKDLSQEMLEHVTRQRESGLTVFIPGKLTPHSG